ncbi:hypothetical protein BH18ACT11_BH18ACT11_24530 [soil metagenome]
MRGIHGPPKLPEGYRLDLASDPDAPALRDPNGVVVARFSARALTEEAIEREALGDLLHRSVVPKGVRSPVGWSQPT